MTLLHSQGMKPRAGWRVRAVQLFAALVITAPTLALSTTPAADTRRSGFDDMGPALQALQRDEAAHPALLDLRDGQARFDADCARCHTLHSLAGVATRYPRWNATSGRPITLSARIAACRTQHLGRPAVGPEHEDRRLLELAVAQQSRGLAIQPDPAPELAPWRARGQRLFEQRIGQLDLSCAQCHQQLAGQRLGGSLIPQGHPTGYPLFRLEWQGTGTLQRRLRACMQGVRAEPAAFDSDELTALELYLMQRAAGMALETPAVRP